MERKLVAIDLDGTTLNNQSSITKETKNIITQVINQGHIVSIATGRPYRNSHMFHKELNLKGPIVNSNGAWCHHPTDKNWAPAYHYHVERETALALTKLNRYSTVKLIAAETPERVYTDRPNGESKGYGYMIEDLKTYPFTKKHLLEDPTSVNIFTESQQAVPFLQEKIAAEYGDVVEVRTWGGQMPSLEIVKAGIQKAVGVEEIANYYNIDRENIIAFGDEDNDYEMIQYAGHGVVMKNGIEELKAISDDITSYTNHENGLARYLVDYFNL